MVLNWPDKDPDEVLDFQIDWLGTESKPGPLFAGGDTINSSTWIVPTGIVKDSDSFTDSTTTVWLSGGTAGERYTMTNRITTVGARTYDQSVRLRIREK